MNNSLGTHYIIDFYNCNIKCLTSVYEIKKLMKKAGQIGKFNIVNNCFHQFKPYGVSGVLVLKESHFTIHTWPEYNYAAVDIFLCDVSLQIDEVIEYLKTILQSNRYEIKMMQRGNDNYIKSDTKE